MRSLIRATTILSIGAFINTLTGMLTSKALAVLLGPTGFGFIGLAQNLISLSEMTASMGVGVALVRSGASALALNNYGWLLALRKAAFYLFLASGSSISMLLILFRRDISVWMLGGIEHADSVALLAIAVLFKIASNMQNGLLSACHRVDVMAKASVYDALWVSTTYIATVYCFGFSGVIPMIIIGTAGSWFISRLFLNRVMAAYQSVPTPKKVKDAALSLLAAGGPYTASLLVGTGVQMILPALVFHLLNPESVGHYRAALSVSMALCSFLIASISKDYYPRISAISDNPKRLVELVNQQQGLVLLVASPVILAGIALSPWIIPLLFSSEFQPAVEILAWQLMGDIFKLLSWTMSYIVFVRCSGVKYFLSEFTAGTINIVSSWFAIRMFGLSGLGISFLITYVIYFLLVWAIVRRDIQLEINAFNRKLLFSTIAIAILIYLSDSFTSGGYQICVAVMLVSAMTIFCFSCMQRQYRKVAESEKNYSRISE